MTEQEIKNLVKSSLNEILKQGKQSESYKERRLNEHKELKERIIKLIDFVYTPESNKRLDDTEICMMTNQLDGMLKYLAQLTHRIVYSEYKQAK